MSYINPVLENFAGLDRKLVQVKPEDYFDLRSALWARSMLMTDAGDSFEIFETDFYVMQKSNSTLCTSQSILCLYI